MGAPLQSEDTENKVSTCAQFVFDTGQPHIFLLSAVMSREALTMRSLRSWCSSNSLRKDSNIGMNGDTVVAVSILLLLGACLMPLIDC